MSKGKSLISFIYSDNKLEKDKVKLLLDLFDYYEENYKTEYDIFSQNENVYTNKAYDPSYDILHESCKKIADRVRNVIIPNSQNIENLKNNFSSGYLSKQIDVMIKAQTDNPSEAIGKAKELIESCCITILEKMKIQVNKNWDIGDLTDKAFEQLQLKPNQVFFMERDQNMEKILKAIFGNLRGMVQKIAELRNLYGDGHGKSANFKGIPSKYAKLVVCSSIALTSFLWDTFKENSGIE